METAQNTIEIPLPVDEAHRKWLAFAEQATTGKAAMGDQRKEEVPADRVVSEAPAGDKGTVSFDAVSPQSTRVTMQLRYNPKALTDAGRDQDWMASRIGMYLDRYKAAAGAR